MNDLTPNDLSHLSEAEFQALCPQGEHAPGPEPLSPAARAVLDAAYALPLKNGQPHIAAALRAAADRMTGLIPDVPLRAFARGVEVAAAFTEAIATELEALPDD